MRNNIKNSKGFTIIEVLIVLAIAGLIMLIVFLAIPALQRNSRNTQRRSDAANLMSGVNEFVANNGGVLPTTVTPGAQLVTLGGATNSVDVKLGFYDPTKVTMSIVTTTALAVGRQNAQTIDSVEIVKGGSCNGNAATYLSTRSIAVVYKGEPASLFCVAS